MNYYYVHKIFYIRFFTVIKCNATRGLEMRSFIERLKHMLGLGILVMALVASGIDLTALKERNS